MEVGTRVNRLEDQEVTGATVLETDGENVLIAYDEGGSVRIAAHYSILSPPSS